jgi:dTDP-glucose 4,6-dehydratase
MVKTHPEIFFACLDNLSEGSNRANLEPIDGCPNWSFVEGDITSESTVRSTMEKHRLDTVMHFAAQTHVDRSFTRPVQFSTANVTGTAVLLKVAHEMGIKRFLHISTDEVYGENVNGMIFDENAHHMPGNPYSASKAGAECLLRGYMSSYGSQLPIVVVRPNNIYGPRQFPEKLIPKFIYRLNRKQRLPLHGGGRSRRSFLFVEDAARAFDLVLHKGVPGEAYNIGATVESTKSVREVATALLSHFGVAVCNAGDYFDVVEDRFKNDASYDIKADKIKALGWTPQVNFEEGLRRTVEWYSQHPAHWTNVDQALLAHNGAHNGACAMTRRASL